MKMRNIETINQTGSILKANDEISGADEPQLEAPGAGLPRIEGWLFKKIVGPLFSAMTPWSLAIRIFQSEGEKALALAEKATQLQRSRRVLIPRLLGMEDSSRYWSVNMTLRHLILVGEIIEDIVIKSSQGQHTTKTLSIVTVKPELDTPETVTEDFRNFLVRFERRLGLEVKDRHSKVIHTHPWLGPISMHEWLCLGGFHQRLHRRQIQLILRKQGGVK